MSQQQPGAIRVPIYIDTTQFARNAAEAWKIAEQEARKVAGRTGRDVIPTIRRIDPVTGQRVRTESAAQLQGNIVRSDITLERAEKMRLERAQKSLRDIATVERIRENAHKAELREANNRQRRAAESARAFAHRDRMRQRFEQQQATALQNQRRESRNRFTNVMMGGVTPAMMGLLGPAGFPFLNIGFAAMSGGPLGAGIAALSTATGQFVMAVNRTRDSLKNMAEAAGIVSREYQIQQSRVQALGGFFGVVETFQEGLRNERLMNQIRGRETQFISSQLHIGGIFDTFRNFFRDLQLRFAEGPFGVRNLSRVEDALTEIDMAILNLQRSRPSGGRIEGSAEMFSRIQRNFSKTGDIAEEQRRQQIELLKQMRDSARQGLEEERARREKAKEEFPPLFTGGLAFGF